MVHVIPLGQDAPVGLIGNKARSFVVFRSLGLRFPPGIVIPVAAQCFDTADIIEILKSECNTIIFDGAFRQDDSKHIDVASAEAKLKELRGKNKELRSLLDSWPRMRVWPGPEFDAGRYHRHGEFMPDEPQNKNEYQNTLNSYWSTEEEISKLTMLGKTSFAVRSSPVVSMPGILATELGVTTPEELIQAIRRVKDSWNNDKAIRLKDANSISSDSVMPIIIQIMVDTFKNKNSGAGVVFSWDPDTGEKGICGAYTVMGAGSSIVSGNITGLQIAGMQEKFPEAFEELCDAMRALEGRLGFPQEVEFAVKDGVLYFLQTRDIKFSFQGEINYLKSVTGSAAGKLTLVPKIEALQQRFSMRKVFKVRGGVNIKVVGKGKIALPGAIFGRLALSIEKAREFCATGPVIFASSDTDEILQSIVSMPSVGIIIISKGGCASHSAVLARAAWIPVIMDITDSMSIEPGRPWRPRSLMAKDGTIKITEGDLIGVDGNSNAVFITDEKEILEECGEYLDVAFGIDIGAHRKKFISPWLNADETKIKPELTLEGLLDLNLQAWFAYGKLAAEGDTKEAFLANLKKHFLHELLIQKALELGEKKEEVEERLRQSMIAGTIKDRGTFLKEELSAGSSKDGDPLEQDHKQASGQVLTTEGKVYEIGGDAPPYLFAYRVIEGHVFKIANTHYGVEEREVGTVQVYHYGEPTQRCRTFKPKQKDGVKQKVGKVLATDGRVYQLCGQGPYTIGYRIKDGIIYEIPACMDTVRFEKEVGRVKVYYYDEVMASSKRVLATDGTVWTLGGTPDDRIYVSNNRILHFMDNHEGGNDYIMGEVAEYLVDDGR